MRRMGNSRSATGRWKSLFALRIAPALLVLAAGCQATWTPTTAAPKVQLQWPFAPAAAKVTYAWALTGIARDTSVGTVLESVVFGSGGSTGGFVQPVAVATGKDGRIAVADTGCRCVHFYLPGTAKALRLAGTDRERIVSPVAVAFDDADRLYVSDSGGALFAFDALGKPRFVVRRAGDRPLQRPTGMVWAPDRQLLYVVDTLAHGVDAFDTDGKLRFSFGKRGAGEGELNFPAHIARSAAGELYVTDTLNFRIAIFDSDGHPTGSFGRHGDGSGDLAMPKGIAVDADGVVYVVDALFDNVQLFNRRGDFLLTLGARGTGFGEFWLPSGAWLGEHGHLYVCDTYNRRVQVFRVESGYANGRS
jgi:DNA-binding beta-propeller fold protein YncE